MENIDKAGTEHWEKVWEKMPLLPKVDPNAQGMRHYITRQWHGFFSRAIRDQQRIAHNVIELGCAHSVWLPYFWNEYHLDPWGLDYIESGCESARAVLRRDGVRDDQVCCGSIFDPPLALIGQFDVVYSSGLIEHFPDTAQAIRACANFVKPGGRLITIVPNMRGLTGWLQRTLDREVYDKHIPLDLGTLRGAHWDAGLREVFSEHLGVFNFWVLNLNDRRPWFRKAAFKIGGAATLGLGALHERHVPLVWPNGFTSPSIGCVFRKPE